MNKKEKPISPFIINPENFLKLVENFIVAYPTYYHRLKQLSDLGEKECKDLSLTNRKNSVYWNKQNPLRILFAAKRKEIIGGFVFFTKLLKMD